jgi:hypothetical protein
MGAQVLGVFGDQGVVIGALFIKGRVFFRGLVDFSSAGQDPCNPLVISDFFRRIGVFGSAFFDPRDSLGGDGGYGLDRFRSVDVFDM